MERKLNCFSFTLMLIILLAADEQGLSHRERISEIGWVSHNCAHFWQLISCVRAGPAGWGLSPMRVPAPQRRSQIATPVHSETPVWPGDKQKIPTSFFQAPELAGVAHITKTANFCTLTQWLPRLFQRTEQMAGWRDPWARSRRNWSTEPLSARSQRVAPAQHISALTYL